MTIKNKLLHFCVLFLTTTIFQTSILFASEIKYQEHASDIIMNSLQTQKQQTFLRDLYKQLFFVPVWMHEKSISSAAKDLFSYIDIR